MKEALVSEADLEEIKLEATAKKDRKDGRIEWSSGKRAKRLRALFPHAEDDDFESDDAVLTEVLQLGTKRRYTMPTSRAIAS